MDDEKTVRPSSQCDAVKGTLVYCLFFFLKVFVRFGGADLCLDSVLFCPQLICVQSWSVCANWGCAEPGVSCRATLCPTHVCWPFLRDDTCGPFDLSSYISTYSAPKQTLLVWLNNGSVVKQHVKPKLSYCCTHR